MDYRKIKQLFYTYAFFDDFILIYPLYAVMFADKGLNPAQISSLFIVWSITTFILEVPSGSVADKYPRKNVLLFATAIRALAFASWLFIPNYFGYLLGFLLWGINSAFSSGTEEALVYDEMKRVNQTGGYAKVTGTMQSLRLISMILGGFVASAFARSGYGILLGLSVTSILLAAIPIYLLPKARAIKSTEETRYWDYLKEGVGLVRRNTKLLFIIGFAAIVVGLSAADEYYDLFFREKGFSNSWIAFLIGIVCLFGAIGSAIAYKLQDKRIPLTASMFLGAVLLVAATLVPPVLSPVLIGLYAGYICIVGVLFDAYAQREILDKNRATMTSVKSLVTEVFVLISFGLFAVTSQIRSYTFGFQATAFVVTIMAAAYRLLRVKYEPS